MCGHWTTSVVIDLLRTYWTAVWLLNYLVYFKVLQILVALKRINHCLSPTALQYVYYGLVQSPFDYCSMVWGRCGKTLRDKL